jgi:hypothetical protein
MSTNPVTSPSEKGQKIWLVRGAALAAMTGILAAIAPMVWLAVSAGAGIVVLAGLAAAGFVAIQALPLGLQTLENRLLRARKAQAHANPIEQLQNEVLRRGERLRTFQTALVAVGGQIESIGQLLEERRYKDPGHVLSRQQQALTRLQQFHRVNLARLAQAHAALGEFRFTVERKDSEWRIAMAIGEANAVLDPHASENLMQDLLTDTALRSVQDRFNQVFAELDVQMSSLGGANHSVGMDWELLSQVPNEASTRQHQRTTP